MTTLEAAHLAPPISSTASEWWPVPIPQEAYLLDNELADRNNAPRTASHFPIALHIHGRLNTEALERALNGIIQRHAGLRAAYLPTHVYESHDRRRMLDLFARQRLFVPGLLFGQRIFSELRVTIAHRTATDCLHCEQDDLFASLAADEGRAALQLDVAPVMRATVISVNDVNHIFVFTVSHLVVDGWSAALFREELIALYSAYTSGRACALPPVTSHAGEFARNEHDRLKSGGFFDDARYWTERLTDAADALIGHEQLPSFRHRPTDSGGIRMVTHRMAAAESDQIRHTLRTHRLTAYVFFRTAFLVLLHTYTQRTRIAWWTNFANRRDRKNERMMGSCARAHIVSMDVSLDVTILDLCRTLARTLADGQPHEAVPESAFAMLGLLHLNIRKSTGVAFDAWPSVRRRPQDAVIEPLLVPAGRSWINLDVRFRDELDTFVFYTTYNERRHSTTGIASMMDDLMRIISVSAMNITSRASSAVHSLSYR